MNYSTDNRSQPPTELLEDSARRLQTLKGWRRKKSGNPTGTLLRLSG